MSATRQKPPVDGRSKKRPGLEEQRRILVDAAVKLFVQHGTRAVSVSQVCGEANVSRDTYYRCFEDKDALIDDIWERAANAHIETFIFHSLPNGGSLEAWLPTAIDQLFDAVFEEHELAHFMFVEFGDPGSRAHVAINQMFEGYAQQIQAYFHAYYGVRPSTLFLTSIMAAVQWILLSTMRGGLDAASIATAKNEATRLTTAAFLSLARSDES
ncbi:MAG: TetR/AcrR family transcriptional regulator [Myxococcota bacterium]